VTFTKLPKADDATLDYVISWATWLDGDTITASTWTVDDGMTEASSGNTDTTTTIWLSGGTLGNSYTIMNHITTTAGRIEDYSFVIVCEQT
jgi:hypothetical protein